MRTYSGWEEAWAEWEVAEGVVNDSTHLHLVEARVSASNFDMNAAMLEMELRL